MQGKCDRNYIQQPPPIEGECRVLTTAISPRRRRMTPSAARERSSQGTDRSHWEAHGLAQTISIFPFHKSFAELFQKRPFPPFPKLYPAIPPRRRRMTLVSRSRAIFLGNGSLTLGSTWTCTNYILSNPPHKSFAELFQKRPFPRIPASQRTPYFHKKGL